MCREMILNGLLKLSKSGTQLDPLFVAKLLLCTARYVLSLFSNNKRSTSPRNMYGVRKQSSNTEHLVWQEQKASTFLLTQIVCIYIFGQQKQQNLTTDCCWKTLQRKKCRKQSQITSVFATTTTCGLRKNYTIHLEGFFSTRGEKGTRTLNLVAPRAANTQTTSHFFFSGQAVWKDPIFSLSAVYS